MSTLSDYRSLQFLRFEHYWLEPANRIGRMTSGHAVFTQRCIDPKHNTAGPWLSIAWKMTEAAQ